MHFFQAIKSMVEKSLTAQEQLRAENEELKWRRKKEEDWHKANDQRVACYDCHKFFFEIAIVLMFDYVACFCSS